MRIACIYLPAFALQVQVRQAPHRAGSPFAVVHGPRDAQGELSGSRAVLVCSKAAWEMGIRPGMSAPQARALAPDVELLASDATLYQRALEALAESLMVHSLSIDIGAEGEGESQANIAVYLRVPKASRGDDFAQTLLLGLDRQGYKARIGIADNRFTAWAAAQGARTRKEGDLFAKEYCTVPTGGSAAFLAPLRIDLLPLSTDVQHMLETLGIKTLGNFASLPPPSVGRRWNAEGVDFQSLAQGEGPTLLQSFTPKQVIIESIDLEHEVAEIEALAFSLRPLADRACDRLRGRSMAVGRALLRLKGRDDSCSEFSLDPARPTADGRRLFELLRAVVKDQRLDHTVCELELTISEECDPEIEELDLFSGGVLDHQDRPSPESVDVAIARLESMFGKDSVSSAQLTESHRPERAFRLTPFAPPRNSSTRNSSTRKRSTKRARKSRAKRASATRAQAALPLVMNGTSGAMRLLDPPTPQPPGDDPHLPLSNITIEGIQSPVVATFGPTKVNTEWWSNTPVSRDYYEVETKDGGRYWVFKKTEDGQYYLHGIFD
ncbi:MAG: DNA polymerase Y family protein [Myxococcales bacterium]|nr:DNA polymerase Y family protein [Myxococcales bacterium]